MHLPELGRVSFLTASSSEQKTCTMSGTNEIWMLDTHITYNRSSYPISVLMSMLCLNESLLSFYLISVSICLLNIYLPFCLYNSLSVCQSIYLFIYPSIHISIYPSIYQSIHISIYPATYLHISLSLFIHLNWAE